MKAEMLCQSIGNYRKDEITCKIIVKNPTTPKQLIRQNHQIQKLDVSTCPYVEIDCDNNVDITDSKRYNS